MKKITTILMLVPLLIGVVSCSKDDEPKEEAVNILGTWQSVETQTADGGSVTTIVEWTFKANGSATEYVKISMKLNSLQNDIILAEETLSFTYTFDGNTITLTSSTNEVLIYTVTVSGNAMEMGNADDGYFDLTKQ